MLTLVFVIGMLVTFNQNDIEKYKVKYKEDANKFKTVLKVDYNSNISKANIKTRANQIYIFIVIIIILKLIIHYIIFKNQFKREQKVIEMINLNLSSYILVDDSIYMGDETQYYSSRKTIIRI